jgi:tRNA G37 N-methylase TrmD
VNLGRRPVLEALPTFTWPRGGIRFRSVPDVHAPGKTPEQLAAWRERERIRRDRQARWDRIRDQHCVCVYRLESNGDPYEDERRRVDRHTCPVHGDNEEATCD